MQYVLLDDLQQGAAMTVHDALRDARGAGRIHDEQRVVERHRLEDELGAGLREGLEHHRIVDCRHVGRSAGKRHHDGPLDAGNGLDDLSHRG